eukprot:TRINITY_DN5047_c0_g1_i3.p1 TRINITY_DN5047_c0_g1~~TRINITY_DN5047_c0_g1_i3.p1  ORF type:complete len:412 (+),score=101.41 TRINITY_DN5047_c0_g1_i3:507-1742(+)
MSEKEEEEYPFHVVHNEQTDKEGRRLLKQFQKGVPHIKWFEKPHTISALVLLGIGLIYVAFNREDSNLESNTKAGLVAVCCCFLIYSATQARDGLFARPHPIFWRVIQGLGVLYCCLLVFLLFQNVGDTLKLLKHLDPTLGVPLPERSYAENCAVYTPNDPESNFRNIRDAVNDEFMIAHFLGWWGKAILFRDFYLLWFMSITFELMELSLKHLLPNFAECWWDHVILDILTMNALGIWLGLKFCKWFKMRRYGWVSAELEEYNWNITKSWKRFVAVITIMVVLNVVELNAFFLKYVLYIPPPHIINILRLFLVWGLAMPATREFYQYVSDPLCKRFGTSCWLVVAGASLELLVWVKYARSQRMFEKPAPTVVVYSWITAISVLFLWAVWFYGFKNNEKVENQQPTRRKVE